MTKRKHSALFRYIEDIQGNRNWGAVLDAGTGANSLRWISSMPTERWTAVTGSASEATWIGNAIKAEQRPQDRLIEGNWANPELLAGETFDTVLADYLLGAVEGFAPYFQTYLLARLRPLTRGMLYITGLEPYVPTAQPDTEAGRLVWEIGRFRDACVLLAGHRPYREYPAQWVVDNAQHAGFAVRKLKHFRTKHGKQFVNAQIDIVMPGLDQLKDQTLAKALRARGETLRADALNYIEHNGPLPHCRSYVIAAEPV